FLFLAHARIKDGFLDLGMQRQRLVQLLRALLARLRWAGVFQFFEERFHFFVILLQQSEDVHGCPLELNGTDYLAGETSLDRSLRDQQRGEKRSVTPLS